LARRDKKGYGPGQRGQQPAQPRRAVKTRGGKTNAAELRNTRLMQANIPMAPDEKGAKKGSGGNQDQRKGGHKKNGGKKTWCLPPKPRGASYKIPEKGPNRQQMKATKGSAKAPEAPTPTALHQKINQHTKTIKKREEGQQRVC